MMFSKYNEHTGPPFKNLGLLKLPDLIIISIFLFMQNRLPDVFNNFFPAEQSNIIRARQGRILIFLKRGVEKFLVGCKRHD